MTSYMKHINLLIAATLFFGACARTDTIDEVMLSDVSIGFSTGFVDNVTKSYDNGEKSGKMEEYGNTFQVWGWKTNENNDPVIVFNGQTVTYTESSVQPSDWTYSPLKYWDRKALSYNFYAVSPANSDNELLISYSKFEFDNDIIRASVYGDAVQTLFYNADMSSNTDARDLLVADRVHREISGASQGSAAFGNVEFVFRHILSKLDIYADCTEGYFEKTDGSLATPNIKLNYLNVYIGGLCYKYSHCISNEIGAGTDSWTDIDPYYPVLDKAPDAKADNRLRAADEPYDLFLRSSYNINIASYLITPSPTGTDAPVNRIFIMAEYDIEYEYDNQYKETEHYATNVIEVLDKNGEPAIPAFRQGYRYCLNITFGPGPISFHVDSIHDFEYGTDADISVK